MIKGNSFQKKQKKKLLSKTYSKSFKRRMCAHMLRQVQLIIWQLCDW